MHVFTLQTQPPKFPPKSTGTGHAFVPATAQVPTVAEAAAMTEHLRQLEGAANQEVSETGTPTWQIQQQYNLLSCSSQICRLVC